MRQSRIQIYSVFTREHTFDAKALTSLTQTGNYQGCIKVVSFGFAYKTSPVRNKYLKALRFCNFEHDFKRDSSLQIITSQSFFSGKEHGDVESVVRASLQ